MHLMFNSHSSTHVECSVVCPDWLSCFFKYDMSENFLHVALFENKILNFQASTVPINRARLENKKNTHCAFLVIDFSQVS